MKKNGLLYIAGMMCIVGIFLMTFIAFDPAFNDWSCKLSPELASQYGSFINGLIGHLFALVGIIFIYVTISNQRENFKKQQFETKFFELVRYHRENVANMNDKSGYSKDGEIISGTQVFIYLKKQCNDIVYDVKKLIPNDKNLKEEEYIKKILNISILSFYYGVSKRTKETLTRVLKKYIADDKERDRIIEGLCKNKKKYNNEIVFYGGHQSKLGQYFRHLYHTVKFVDEIKFLTDSEKQKYIKILRAQLTNYEQALIFYNSMSPLGRKWKELGYIEKYGLIKNLPMDFLGSIDFTKFYQMEYEHEEW